MMWSTRSTPARLAWWAMEAARYRWPSRREASGSTGGNPQSCPLGNPWSGGAPTDIPSANSAWRDHAS